MKNINVRQFTFIFVGISAAAWLLFSLTGGGELSDVVFFLSQVPKVVTFDLAVFAVFTRWVWKWDFLQGWLVPFPDLNGTWVGDIHSDWENPETGKRVAPIPTMLTIKQSMFNISCVMHTGEMKSYSYSEDFQIDGDRQLKQLAYLYTSNPRIVLRDRSGIHDGAMVFDVSTKDKFKMSGRYWTERKTTGEVNLRLHTTEMLDALPKSLGDHPVTEDKHKR